MTHKATALDLALEHSRELQAEVNRLNDTINTMHKHLYRALTHLEGYNFEGADENLSEVKALQAINRALSHAP